VELMVVRLLLVAEDVSIIKFKIEIEILDEGDKGGEPLSRAILKLLLFELILSAFIIK